MFRKLIIAISLVCAITLVSGCADSEKESRPRKESTKKEETQKPPKAKEEETKKLTEDEVCELICGYYINKSYLDDFEITKSAVASQGLGETLMVMKDESTGQYSIMHGDLHQGNALCALTEIKYMEDTNEYYVYFEPYFDSEETLLIYNADTNSFSYRGYGRMKLTEDEFIRFDNYDDHKAYLAYLVLKGTPNVAVQGQQVYTLAQGSTKLIEIHSDAMFDFPEAPEMLDRGLCGYAHLHEPQDDARDFYYYFIEDGIFTIQDIDANILFSTNLN